MYPIEEYAQMACISEYEASDLSVEKVLWVVFFPPQQLFWSHNGSSTILSYLSSFMTPWNHRQPKSHEWTMKQSGRNEWDKDWADKHEGVNGCSRHTGCLCGVVSVNGKESEKGVRCRKRGPSYTAVFTPRGQVHSMARLPLPFRT